MAAKEDSNSVSGSVAGGTDDPQIGGHVAQDRPDDDDGLSVFHIAESSPQLLSKTHLYSAIMAPSRQRIKSKSPLVGL